MPASASVFQRHMSEVIGPLPQIAPKKHCVRCGTVECGAAEDRLEKMYSDIRRWSKMPKGGHFAALEQPQLLAHEIREFFRPLR